MYAYFFFSSRRRHTRFDCDWSSDVCSSDLHADVRWLGPNSVEVNTARAEPRELDPALCARIRASILLAGPMLARFGRVSLPPPGGDVIGRRRVDTHFLALERLGAEVTIGAAYQLEAKSLTGAD